MPMNWRDVAPLAAYINRVGAQQLNFRKFIIREDRGNYYVEKTIITLAPDGEITCGDAEYAPTGEEAAAIKAAFLNGNFDFPTWVKAPPAKLPELRTLIGTSDPLYEFYERGTDTVIMVQQRGRKADGSKQYNPWSYWSDGIWRRMEPDCKLPIWKPRFSTNKRRIMMHEGAKPAAAVHALCSDPARRAELGEHPWFEELVEYEHWGVIGGALAPKRTDFTAIRTEKPLELIYVCDNDFPGKDVLQAISKLVNYPLKGVMFDDSFPKSWDMADPLPRAMFSGGGRWIGNQLRSYMKPATWATAQRKEERKTITSIRKDFAEEWSHCVNPDVYVHHEWSDRIYGPDQFNDVVAPYSDILDTATLLKKTDACKQAVLQYEPGLPPGVYISNGDRFINTHKPPGIKSEAGDASRWIDFMKHLVPVMKDRQHLLRWCATLIAKPTVKMHYGVLLISETQGVGKGTLGERILAPLIGVANVSQPSEHDIVDNAFNYWSAHKRLAVVHEIYAGHSAKAYNRLKSLVTDKTITVSKKYMAEYQIENWLHIFACSNSKRALKLDDQDRRWLVPAIGDDKRNAIYWQEFNHWLTQEGGLCIIKGWAEKFVQEHGTVMPGQSAPKTVAKDEVVREGWSPGQIWVADFLEQMKTRNSDKKVFMTDADLIEGIKQMVHGGRQSEYLERPYTVQKVAKQCGWYVGRNRVYAREWNRRGGRAYLIATTPELANAANPAQVASATDLKFVDVVQEARNMDL